MDISREELTDSLGEDLAREYQAVIAYITYSQKLMGTQHIAIAAEREVHAHEELQHALTIIKQVDYLGGDPTVEPRLVKTTGDAKDLPCFDQVNGNTTSRNSRERVRQCEALNEFALAEGIRQILVQEQAHQINLATTLGEDVPDVRPMAGANNKNP